MAFAKALDILGKTADYHRRARAIYAGYGRRKPQSSLTTLANFMTREESEMLRMLSEMERAHAVPLSHMWLQFEPDADVEIHLGEFEANPPQDFEELGERALNFQGQMCGYLNRAVEMSPTPGIKEFFEGVEQRECGQRRRLAGFLSEELL